MPPINASDMCNNASNLCVGGIIIMPLIYVLEALFA